MQKQNWLALSILVLATCHQLLLCFIHTHVSRLPSNTLAVTELCIFAACLPVLLRHIPPLAIALIAAILFNFMILSLFGRPLEFKPVRDVLLPVVFFWLGRNTGSREFADRALGVIVAIVVFFGCFEFFFLEQYTKIFDITGYFVSRGMIDSHDLFWIKSGLFASGIRPEGLGRSLFPFLGNHRASSVFLEPVSLGNFAVIVAAWGLAKGKEQFSVGLGFFLAAVFLAILSDSRYAVVAIAALAAMRTLGTNGYLIASVLPFLAITITIVTGTYFADSLLSDNTLGRLARSGAVLLRFSESQFLGMDKPEVAVFDAGYAYAIASFGAALCFLLWATFWIIPIAEIPGKRFRRQVSVYIAFILCVSGSSLFAMKTAGVLWFLVGIVSSSWVASGKTERRSGMTSSNPRWRFGISS